MSNPNLYRDLQRHHWEDHFEDEAEQAKPSWWDTASPQEIWENDASDREHQRRVDDEA